MVPVEQTGSSAGRGADRVPQIYKVEAIRAAKRTEEAVN
jgi:hypothetical protein